MPDWLTFGLTQLMVLVLAAPVAAWLTQTLSSRAEHRVEEVVVTVAGGQRLYRLASLWVPIIRSWALTRGFALHPGASCVASSIGSSRCLYGWRCVAGTRRTLRSASYGTSSAYCTAATTDRSWPTRTGPC